MQGRKKGVKMRLQNMFKKTGERENPKANGRRVVKELGKMTP